MKKIIILLFVLLAALNTYSQQDEYSDQYLGWIKMQNPNEPQKPYSVDHRKYSATQMSTSAKIVSWVQQSYTPKGAIGQAFKLVNEKLGLYNQQTKSLPLMYGAFTKTFIELKKNPQNKWMPYTNTNWFMKVAVNGQIGDYIDIITTPEQYYFYIPGEEGLGTEEKSVADLLGFTSHPVFKKYISWYQPKGIRTTLQYAVLLCKDNQKPYVQLTRGEYLDELGKAIERDYAERIAKIKRDNSNDSKSIKKFTDYEKEAYDRRIIAFAKLKEKHKHRLTEKAFTAQEQPGIHLENNQTDIFGGEQGSSRFAIYKFDPATLAKSKSDTPQWIIITWDAEGVANGDLPGTHLHESMMKNLDYDYIYNYFFYPEKVKETAYKPLRSPTTEEKTVLTEKSPDAKKMESDASVFFFEDFSANATGQKPAGWKSDLNFEAKYSSVTTLAGKEGKWLEIKGQNNLIPLNLKKPLPQNFELSFDVAVPKDIPCGAKGLLFYMGTNNKYVENGPALTLKLRAGYGGRPGEVSLTGSFGSGYFTNNKPYYDATGFSNDKEINQVKIMLRKKGESLEFFIDKNKIADIPKAFPANSSFNWLQFSHPRSDGDNQKYFITNLKIGRL